MEYSWDTFPSTTVPNAFENLDFDKAVEIISDIATWVRKHKAELRERMNKDSKRELVDGTYAHFITIEEIIGDV